MVKEYNIEVLSNKFGLEDTPDWLYKFDHGKNISTGHMDFFVPSNKLKKVLTFFKRKKLKVKVIGVK